MIQYTKYLLLTTCYLLLAAAPTHAAFEFERYYIDESYGGNTKPGWVRSADMDNDGDKDLIAGGGGALFIYENDGNPNQPPCNPHQNNPPPPNCTAWKRYGNLVSGANTIGANGAIIYDVNNDGHLDVISAVYNTKVGWWQNPGGAFSNTAWSYHPIIDNTWYLHDVIAADLDNDPTTTEFIANLNSGYWNSRINLRWFRATSSNPQSASDWEVHTIELDRVESAHGHAGLSVADIDQDGDQDIAYANGWYENTSGNNATSWIWRELTQVYGISNTEIYDIDQDNDLDILVAAGHHGQGVYWLENTGTPLNNSSWTQHNISNISSAQSDTTTRYTYENVSNRPHDALQHPECLQISDLDFDGDPDVVTCDLFFGEDPGEPDWSVEADNIYVYENLGNASSFTPHNIYPLPSYPSHLLSLTDVDQDGLLDIISEAAGYQVISYYHNVGSSPPPPPISFSLEEVDSAYGGNGRPGWSSSGDVNGDGLIDVVSGGGGALQWYAAPNWTKHDIESGSNAGGNGGLVMDVDGDGDLDVLAARFNSSMNWWENPGGGSTSAWQRHDIHVGGPAANFNHDLIAVNLDGDADLELVALYVGGGIYWYDKPADPKAGDWPAVRILNTIADPQVGLAAGDLDGDGDNDVIASNLWFEHPGGTTPDWTQRTVFTNPVQNLYVYDVNGDGNVDVVGAEGFVHPNGSMLWAQNPGDPKTGTWTEHIIGTNLDGPENLWVGDLNNDTFPDVMTGAMGTSNGFNDNGSNLLVFMGQNGSGTSWQSQELAANVGVSARLMPVDIDGDGDIDFTADGNAEDHIYLWRNTTPQQGAASPTPDPNATATPTPIPQAPCPLPGDTNSCDNIVNILDYSFLSANFGSNNPLADIKPDGTINVLDYTILSNNFGNTLSTIAAINVGGPQYTSADNTNYQADTYFTGGDTFTATDPITSTTDDTLYQSERYGDFSYAIPLPSGTYSLTLKFAEVWATVPGQRIFDITAEGQTIVDDLDLVTIVGHDAAYDITVPIAVTDGQLNIATSALVNNPKLSAILITTN